jgi:acetoacetate decarboxylase
LCTKWKNICKRRTEHVEDYEMMSLTASPEQITLWSHLAEEADMNRLDDVSAMDIYNVALPTG